MSFRAFSDSERAFDSASSELIDAALDDAMTLLI